MINMEIATTEEKFYSAVELIKSLPKTGSVQTSNEVKLKFYSYFKQATEGPCEVPRPSFWDVVNRAKWDAWNKLGTMSRQDAMKNYVEEFIKILQETPFDDKDTIREFIHIMGPYIDYAPTDLKDEILQNGKVKKIPNKPEDINEDCKINNGRPHIGYKNDFPEDSSEGVYSVSSTLNGHNINGNDSDNDEFSDTVDQVNDFEYKGPNGDTAENSATLVAGAKGPSIVNVRGGGDQRVGRRDGSSPAANTSANAGNTSSWQAINPDGSSQQASGNVNVGGTGGSRRNGGNVTLETAADNNEQLALAVIRLQHTMEQVVTRLDSLEALLLEKKASSSLEVSSRRKSFWSFMGISPKAAFVILAWPFVVHWLVYIIRKRQRKIFFSRFGEQLILTMFNGDYK